MNYILENAILRFGVSDFRGELRSLVGEAAKREYLWQGKPKIFRLGLNWKLSGSDVYNSNKEK